MLGKKLPSMATLLAAVENQQTSLDNPGFCTDCGAEHGSCEPDARNYPCEECDSPAVYGAEELLLMVG